MTACFGAENASWSPFKSAPGVVAYPSCPGGIDASRGAAGEGLYVRNVMAPGLAAPGAAAGWRFDAPAGTRITGVAFDARLLRNPGWEAGLRDAAGRWLWCGDRCSTSVGQWVHDELRGLSTSRLETLVRCVAPHCRRERLRAFVGLRDVRVALDDPVAPSLGAIAGAGDGWLRGRIGVLADARDATGIRAERVELDGGAVHAATRSCDFTRTVPCANGPLRASFDTRTWSDGAHRLRLGVSDAGGSWTWRERTVRVDNTPPPEAIVAVDGGAGWSAAAERTLRVTLPAAQAAPVVRARLTICHAGQCAAPVARTVGANGAVAVGALAGPGEYAIRVALEDAAGNIGPAAPPVTLRFDDTVPGAPDLSAADAWLRGDAPLPLAATGPAPPSGIAGFRVGDRLLGPSLSLDAFAEGTAPIEVRTISGAGVASTAVRTLVRIDRTAPTVGASGVPAGDGWVSAPVRVALRARDDRSGVARIAWQAGAGPESSAPGEDATVALGEDGRHEIRYRALDAAGNASAEGSFLVRVDRTPPGTVAFEAPDPADPTQVRVVVADATSGVASGTIAIRAKAGAWKPLDTALRHDRLVARIDDAALRAGAYELRARAVDAAGNAAVGTARTDGAPATVRLPLRRAATMSASRSGPPGHRPAPRRRRATGRAGGRLRGAPPRPHRVASDLRPPDRRPRARRGLVPTPHRRERPRPPARPSRSVADRSRPVRRRRRPPARARVGRGAHEGGGEAARRPARRPRRSVRALSRTAAGRARPGRRQAGRRPGARGRPLADVRDRPDRPPRPDPAPPPVHPVQRRPDLPLPPPRTQGDGVPLRVGCQRGRGGARALTCTPPTTDVIVRDG